jgi:hypothetical protein
MPVPLLDEHKGAHGFRLQARTSQQDRCPSFKVQTVIGMGPEATEY